MNRLIFVLPADISEVEVEIEIEIEVINNDCIYLILYFQSFWT